MSPDVTKRNGFPRISAKNRQFIAIFERQSEFASVLKGLEKAANAV
jgi:hypothetical protein